MNYKNNKIDTSYLQNIIITQYHFITNFNQKCHDCEWANFESVISFTLLINTIIYYQKPGKLKI